MGGGGRKRGGVGEVANPAGAIYETESEEEGFGDPNGGTSEASAPGGALISPLTQCPPQPFLDRPARRPPRPRCRRAPRLSIAMRRDPRAIAEEDPRGSLRRI
eukprot:gene13209-biopygen4390